jgi:predicted ATPase
MSAPRTIVSTTTTSSDPTILAARREMQSWKTLALEPTAMRSPDLFTSPQEISTDGAHIAATLYRLATQPKTGDPDSDPDSVYAGIAARASKLVSVRELRISRDNQRQLLTLELREGKQGFLPARALSDGTLRFLALCVLDADPDVRGVVCMEEPENGIHPARMQAMVDLVRGLAVDPAQSPAADNPMRQILVNTHSPAFVQLQDPGDILFAETVTTRSPKGEAVKTLRLMPIRNEWRTSDGTQGVGVSDILAYLTNPPGAQLRLTMFDINDKTAN